MKQINDRSEIPSDMTEAEEAAFWAEHEAGPGLLAQTQADADAGQQLAELDTLRANLRAARSAKSNPTSLRLGADLERRLRHLAELKGTTYQTLLKEFVLERVYEEEKRLKVI